MKRTTIVAPEDVLEKLRAIAEEEHVSLAAVIREALAERAAHWYPKTGPRPMPKAVGIFDSGYTNTAERASNGFTLREQPDSKSAPPNADRERPKPKSFGIGASQYTDTARRAGDEPPEPDRWR